MTEKLKAFCCWSGGKESALSLYKAKRLGFNTLYLLNMVSENGKHSRSHGINFILLRLQSEAIDIPIIQRKTSWGNYEEEFKKAVLDLKRIGVNIGIFGDIDLQEHRDWVERVCGQMDIKPIMPLWKREREELLKEFINLGFKAIVCATQPSSLGKEWLGRKIDEKFIEDLKVLGKVDLCGEAGEYHTFVFDGPIFKRLIDLIPGNITLKDNHWFLELR